MITSSPHLSQKWQLSNEIYIVVLYISYTWHEPSLCRNTWNTTLHLQGVLVATLAAIFCYSIIKHVYTDILKQVGRSKVYIESTVMCYVMNISQMHAHAMIVWKSLAGEVNNQHREEGVGVCCGGWAMWGSSVIYDLNMISTKLECT